MMKMFWGKIDFVGHGGIIRAMFFVLTNMGEKKIIQHLNFYQFLGMSYLQKRFYYFLFLKRTLFGSGFLHFIFVFFRLHKYLLLIPKKV